MNLSRVFSVAAGLGLVASVGLAGNVRAEEVSGDSDAVSSYVPNCVANVCEGDYVEIYNGGYSGYRGRVVDTNYYAYTATVYLDIGGYLTVDVRSVSVIDRMPVPRPYPRPNYCPPGYIFDIFRGCVPLVQPRRIPAPHRIPAPPRHPVPGRGRGRVEVPRGNPNPRGVPRRAPSRGNGQRGPGQRGPHRY